LDTPGRHDVTGWAVACGGLGGHARRGCCGEQGTAEEPARGPRWGWGAATRTRGCGNGHLRGEVGAIRQLPNRAKRSQRQRRRPWSPSISYKERALGRSSLADIGVCLRSGLPLRSLSLQHGSQEDRDTAHHRTLPRPPCLRRTHLVHSTNGIGVSLFSRYAPPAQRGIYNLRLGIVLS
jgi:hypothetical protein